MRNRELAIFLAFGLFMALFSGYAFHRGEQVGKATVPTYDQGYRDALLLDKCTQEDDCEARYDHGRWIIVYTPH